MFTQHQSDRWESEQLHRPYSICALVARPYHALFDLHIFQKYELKTLSLKIGIKIASSAVFYFCSSRPVGRVVLRTETIFLNIWLEKFSHSLRKKRPNKCVYCPYCPHHTCIQMFVPLQMFVVWGVCVIFVLTVSIKFGRADRTWIFFAFVLIVVFVCPSSYLRNRVVLT